MFKKIVISNFLGSFLLMTLFMMPIFNTYASTNTAVDDIGINIFEGMNPRQATSLNPHRDRIEATCRDFISVTVGPLPTDAPLWTSKFGGNPFLPLDIPYPTLNTEEPLFLLAQINFSEMPSLEPFPREGLLQFYIQNIDVEEGQDKCKIIYIPTIDKNVLLQDFSTKSKPDEFFPIQAEVLGLTFKKSRMPISSHDRNFKQVYSDILENAETGREFKTNYHNFFYCPPRHASLGGYPFFASYTDPRKLDDDREFSLLQIDSSYEEDGIGFIDWVSCGGGHFFIREDNLRRLDFLGDNVLYFWETDSN